MLYFVEAGQNCVVVLVVVLAAVVAVAIVAPKSHLTISHHLFSGAESFIAGAVADQKQLCHAPKAVA